MHPSMFQQITRRTAPIGLLAVVMLSDTSSLAQNGTNDALLVEARKVNELAKPSNIKTRQDAARYVNAMLQHTRMDLPVLTPELKALIIKAEFRSARDPSYLVSDEKMASAFNRVMDEVGSPAPMRVTAQEIHNYRDAVSVVKEPRPWVYPNAIALGKGSGVQNGARPVEALLTLFLLHQMPENIVWARKRIRQGWLLSTLIEESRDSADEKTATLQMRASGTLGSDYGRTLEVYLKKKGVSALEKVIQEELKRLLDPAKPRQATNSAGVRR